LEIQSSPKQQEIEPIAGVAENSETSARECSAPTLVQWQSLDEWQPPKEEPEIFSDPGFFNPFFPENSNSCDKIHSEH
jgi:hypothetical protein